MNYNAETKATKLGNVWGATGAEPARNSEIPTELLLLREAIERLQKQFNELEQRLVPITREISLPETKEPIRQAPTTRVAFTIYEATDLIDSITTRIRLQTDHTEL